MSQIKSNISLRLFLSSEQLVLRGKNPFVRETTPSKYFVSLVNRIPLRGKDLLLRVDSFQRRAVFQRCLVYRKANRMSRKLPHLVKRVENLPQACATLKCRVVTVICHPVFHKCALFAGSLSVIQLELSTNFQALCFALIGIG